MRIGNHSALRGMTLIELILVLGILAIVLTASTPMLSDFFKGRRSAEEARRLLALTRFARSEAVSRAVPLELWIDDREGVYGLRDQLASAEDQATEPLEYHVSDGLAIAFEPEVTNENNEGSILFLPDGTIDNESVEAIIVSETPGPNNTRRREEDYQIQIARSEVGVGYSILTEEEIKARQKKRL